MKKKLLCMVLIFIFALSIVVLVSCNTSINGDKLVLELNKEGNGYIVSGVTSKKLTKLVMPETYNGLPIVSIGKNAFHNCERLTSITISSSVTSIDCYAFERCRNLTEIKYNGTIEQWNVIEKGRNWNNGVPATKVICSDGEVELYFFQ